MPFGDILVDAVVIPNWHYGNATVELRIDANEPFTSTDGVPIQPGDYVSVVCTPDLTAHTLSIPACNLYNTTNAQDNQAVTYNAKFYDGTSGAKITDFDNYLDFPVAYNPTETTWAKLALKSPGSNRYDFTAFMRSVVDMLYAVQTFVDGDTTPSVAGYYSFKTNNSTTKNITNFKNAYPGKVIYVRIGDTHTSIFGVLYSLGQWLTFGYDGIVWTAQIPSSSSGVSAFNSRAGNVVPLAGDYSVDMITNAASLIAANIFTADQRINGKLLLGGATSGLARLMAQAVAGDYTFQLPNTNPTVGQHLKVSAFSAPNVTIDYETPAAAGYVGQCKYDIQRDFAASGSGQTTTGSGSSVITPTLLTVASPIDFAIGQGICVVGAGTAGKNLITTISNIAGTVITLATPILTTITTLKVQHDDSANINAAIAAVMAAGGGNIFFPAGVYRCNGALIAATNSIIGFSQNLLAAQTINIGLIGEFTPTMGGKTLTSNGVIIDSQDWNDSTPSNFASIISGKTYGTTESNSAAFNFIVPYLQDITFRNKPNPTLAAMQFNNTVGLRISHVIADNGEPNWFEIGVGFGVITQPTHANAVGLITPGVDNFGDVQIDRYFTWGYYIGGSGAEHLKFHNVEIFYCRTGWQFDGSAGDSNGDILITSCNYFLTFISRYAFLTSSTIDLSVHLETEVIGQWFDTANGQQIYDPSNLGIGFIRLNSDNNGVTAPNFVTGGANMTIELGQLGKRVQSGIAGQLIIKQSDSALGAGSQFEILNDLNDFAAFASYGSTYGIAALRRDQELQASNNLRLTTGSLKDMIFSEGAGNESYRIAHIVSGQVYSFGSNVSWNGSNFTLNNTGLSGWAVVPDIRVGVNTYSLRFFPAQSNPATTILVPWQANGDGTLNIKGQASPAVTPTILSGNVNDYSPGVGGFQRWSSTASENVTGMVAGQDGERREIWNVGAQNIVLQHQNAGSAAANRFLCSTGADITLAANKCALAVYDLVSTKWRVTLLP